MAHVASSCCLFVVQFARMLIRLRDIFCSFVLVGACLVKNAELKIEEVIPPLSGVDVKVEELVHSSARKVKRGRRCAARESRKREASKPLYLSRYE